MKITIDQQELEQAVRDYVRKNGVTREVEAIDFTASRGEAGTVTTVTLGSEIVASEPAALTAVPSPGEVNEPAVRNEEADEAKEETAPEEEKKPAGKKGALFGDLR